MLDSEYINSLQELEALKGDRLEIVKKIEAIPQNSRYGVPQTDSYDFIAVPGYLTSSNNTEGLNLGSNRQRITGTFYAYLNVARGFDPSLLKDNAYLLANQNTLYELVYVDRVNWHDKIIYSIYQLQETTNSKQIFDRLTFSRP